MAALKSEIISLLNAAGIAFEVTEHQPIYTVEEGEALKLPHPEAIARTLFLCDDKHQNFWLVTLPKDKKTGFKGSARTARQPPLNLRRRGRTGRHAEPASRFRYAARRVKRCRRTRAGYY